MKSNPRENEAREIHIILITVFNIYTWKEYCLSDVSFLPLALMFLWILSVAAAEACSKDISTRRYFLLVLSKFFQLVTS